MTVKVYPSYVKNTEENARQRAIAEQVAAEFRAEFAAMMAKYKAEISVRECTSGYQTYAEGFDVDFDGIYAEGETVRPYFTVQFGTNETAESIKE
jgi:hypothetical protein